MFKVKNVVPFLCIGLFFSGCCDFLYTESVRLNIGGPDFSDSQKHTNLKAGYSITLHDDYNLLTGDELGVRNKDELDCIQDAEAYIGYEETHGVCRIFIYSGDSTIEDLIAAELSGAVGLDDSHSLKKVYINRREGQLLNMSFKRKRNHELENVQKQVVYVLNRRKYIIAFEFESNFGRMQEALDSVNLF